MRRFLDGSFPLTIRSGYKIIDRANTDGIGGGIWPISDDEGTSKVQPFVRVNDVNGQ